MHKIVQNLISIQSSINSKLLNLKNKEKIPKIIAVSKTFKMDHILPLVEYGHLDYGENKVQETIEKWTDVKIKNDKINLHLIGKLQTNKVKFAVKIFDYIHSLDSEKLAKKISEEQNKIKKKVTDLKNQKAFYINEIKQDSSELSNLRSDSNTQEKFAREKFLMRKDNEDIFIIRKK